jgi:hypothetical protein
VSAFQVLKKGPATSLPVLNVHTPLPNPSTASNTHDAALRAEVYAIRGSLTTLAQKYESLYTQYKTLESFVTNRLDTISAQIDTVSTDLRSHSAVVTHRMDEDRTSATDQRRVLDTLVGEIRAHHNPGEVLPRNDSWPNDPGAGVGSPRKNRAEQEMQTVGTDTLKADERSASTEIPVDIQQPASPIAPQAMMDNLNPMNTPQPELPQIPTQPAC